MYIKMVKYPQFHFHLIFSFFQSLVFHHCLIKTQLLLQLFQLCILLFHHLLDNFLFELSKFLCDRRGNAYNQSVHNASK